MAETNYSTAEVFQYANESFHAEERYKLNKIGGDKNKKADIEFEGKVRAYLGCEAFCSAQRA